MNAAAPWIVSLASILGCIAYVFWLKRSENQDRLDREQQAKTIQARADAAVKVERDDAVWRAGEKERTERDQSVDEWIAERDAKRGEK